MVRRNFDILHFFRPMTSQFLYFSWFAVLSGWKKWWSKFRRTPIRLSYGMNLNGLGWRLHGCRVHSKFEPRISSLCKSIVSYTILRQCEGNSLYYFSTNYSTDLQFWLQSCFWLVKMLVERSELPLHRFWEMFQYHETIFILKTCILIFLRIVRFPKFELFC